MLAIQQKKTLWYFDGFALKNTGAQAIFYMKSKVRRQFAFDSLFQYKDIWEKPKIMGYNPPKALTKG